MDNGTGAVSVGRGRIARAHEVARVIFRVLSVVVVLLAVLVGYGLYRFSQGLEPEPAPDIDKIQRRPAVLQAREAAARQIDAAFVALEKGLGAGFERRTQSLLDECGSRQQHALIGGSRYEPVSCHRQVVRYYLAAGSYTDRVGEIVTALYGTGLYGDHPPSAAEIARECPGVLVPSATPSTDDPIPTLSFAPIQSDVACAFTIPAYGPAPSRGVSAVVRRYDPHAAQQPLGLTGSFEVVGAERVDEPADLGPIDTGVAPSDMCILAILVLVNYHTERK